MRGRKEWVLLPLVAVFVLSLSPHLQAKTQRAGLSFGIGIGAMIAEYPERYLDIGGDLYPEFQVIADVAFVRAGFTVGVVYRWEQEYYWGYWTSYSDYTMVYVPVMADFNLLPLRFASPNLTFQLYVGGCAGFYVGMADVSENVYFCVGPKFGIELFLGEFVVMDFEGRMVSVPDDPELRYFNVLFNVRFRVPFVRRRYY